MTEINFRGWDKESKEMVENVVVTSFDWHKGSQGGTHDTLMQDTGLKDKNSVKIYKDDILGYWGANPNGATWIVGWDENKSGWAAVYGETDLTSSGEPMSGMPAFKLSKKLCEKKEVIGNIYENPELLKK